MREEKAHRRSCKGRRSRENDLGNIVMCEFSKSHIILNLNWIYWYIFKCTSTFKEVKDKLQTLGRMPGIGKVISLVEEKST